MSQVFDVIVVGGGVVGLTAALAMTQRGFSVALVDASILSVNLKVIDPRVYAINQASQTLLEQIGVWQQLDKTRISPYRHMHVWDASNGAKIDFDSRLVAAEGLGHIIEESVLKDALLACLGGQPELTLFQNKTITEIETSTEGVTVYAAKQCWTGRLLMVADGANSPCRELLKVELISRPYQQQAIVALVKTEKSHQQTAYQVFNSDGPLAFLPLPDEKQCSIVWSTTESRANQLMSLSDVEFNEELGRSFANKLGAVEVQGKRHQFPLIMRHAKQYSDSCWLLLGDAAHTIHPLAGLGLNVGLADVSSWLSCLEQSGNDLLSQRALSAYQRQRKHAVWQVIAMMDGLKRLFTNSFPPIALARGLGLRLCNRIPPLKRFFVEQASGIGRD